MLYKKVSSNVTLSFFRSYQQKMDNNSSDDKDIEKILRDAGFDSSWVAHFKSAGATTPASVKQCGSESYETLSKFIKNNLEKKLLLKFLGMDETKSPDDVMAEKLNKAGLNATYWLPKFKDTLGVSTPEELNHCGSESYSCLVKFAQTNHAKRALRLFLHVSDEEPSFKSLREKQKQRVQEKHKKAQETLESLKKFHQEGKQRHDENVKALENSIREALNISPSDWIPPTADLSIVLQELKSYESELGGTLVKRDDLTSLKLIEQVSDGQMLRGIINVSNQAVERSTNFLLRCHDGISLRGTVKDTETKIERFTSIHQENSYIRNMERYGATISASVKAGITVCVEAGISATHTEETQTTTKHHEETTYLSTVKSAVMPMALCSFEDETLLLSRSAISFLQDLEDLLRTKPPDDIDIQMSCEKFFNKFGSSANRGPYQLGGIYWWKSFSEGFKQEDIKEIKRLQSDSLSASAGISYMSVGVKVDGRVENATGKAEGTSTKEIKNKVNVNTGQRGGPPEVSSLPQWKDGLVASNSTWKMIGQDINLVYVWDILKMNHSKEFTNVDSLAQVLSRSWEQVLSKIQKWNQFLLENDDAKKILDRIQLWIESKDKSKCLQHLTELVEVRECLSSSKIWCEFYLNQLVVQYYLLWVIAEMKDDQSSAGEAVRGIMKQILVYSEVMQLQDFPNRARICDWLYPVKKAPLIAVDTTCSNLASLVTFLQKLIESITLYEVQGIDTLKEANELLTRAVSRLRKDHMQKGEYDHLLLITLLVPLSYNWEECFFKNELSKEDLSCLHHKLKDVLKNSYCDVLQAQAQLFLEALQPTFVEVQINASDLSSHIKYMMDTLPNLQAPIRNVLVKCQSQSSFNFHELSWLLKEMLEKRKQPPMDVQEENEVKPKVPILSVKKEESKVNCHDHEYEDFLRKLDFLKYYPQKLTLQDALVIDSLGLANSNDTYDPHRLLPMMLEKIKMSNHNCRKVLLYGPRDSNCDKNMIENNDNDICDESEDDLEDEDINNYSDDGDDESINSGDHCCDKDDYDDESDVVLTHPMDNLIALIDCSDNFLRQTLYKNLSTSQIAVPLLLPDRNSGTLTFPLWAFRSTVKYWKCKVPDSLTGVSREGRLVDCEAPLVSFFRFSHPESYSKSTILNKVISDSKHDYFFNNECKGSSVERKFVDGIVETCWYLPSGEDSDHFNDLITFVNLRGNAGSHKQQFDFLAAHSYISFIFLTESDIDTYKTQLRSLKEAKGKICFLMNTCLSKKQAKLEKLVPKCAIIHLSGKEPAIIVELIQKRINTRLSQSKFRQQYCQLSNVNFNDYGIVIDEKFQSCQAGKELALKLMDTMKDIAAADVKGIMVPLQGPDLWHKWASLNKKQNRMKAEEMGQVGLEKFNKTKREEKENIRKQQLEKAKKFSPVMSIFIDVLLNQPEDVIAYFLQWLEFYLDDRSRKELPSLHEKCKHSREILRKKEAASKEEEEIIRRDLKRQDEALILASFGVEHLFRELGQIYECIMEMKHSVEAQLLMKVKQFPKIAARLLLKGHSLEIVDGDAAHIPQLWTTAVFENVKNCIGKSKMIVLSVLGIQSTGKSTLMNTLFGVRFAVSAGRCTRGAYYQLMKVNSSVSAATKCDYILIIDTEGLRAPELDSQDTQQHDNELATLVIGLADVTIINIFGEVPADINDILQTTVHAFLRMRKVELKPSCQFVRHHVSNVSANKSNEGSQRFQRTLDEMTVLAAKAEHCEGQYELFSDVITFNNETDVQNFPNLWETNPPMAPVNPAYCEAAQKLKSKFIELCESPDALCTIDEFRQKTATLWEAILTENFVFSFKNTLEVEAYSNLDAEYGKWSWQLQNLVLNWQSTTQNRIKSSRQEDLVIIEQEQINKITASLDEQYESIKEDVKLFFENPNSSLAPTMAQWRHRYETKLDTLVDDYKQNAYVFCKSIIQKRHARAELDEMKKHERDHINQQLKELVSELNIDKDKELTKKDFDLIQRKFNEKWDMWMIEVKKRHHPLQKQDLSSLILHCVRSKCQLNQHDTIIRNKIKEIPLEYRGMALQLVINEKEHLNFGVINKIASYFVENREKSLAVAREITDKLLSKVTEYFNQLQLQDFVKYEDTHIICIVRELIKTIEEFEKTGKGKGNFNFKIEYRVDLVLEMAGYALRVFTKIEDDAIKNHPVTYLTSLRSSYSETFKALCTATAREIAAAMCLHGIVVKQLQVSLHEKLVLELANDVRSNNSVFTSKKSLKGEILLQLLKKRDFQAYKQYLRQISQCYFEWIEHYTMEHCKIEKDGKKKVIILAENQLKFFVTKIISFAETARKSSTRRGIKEWLTSFQTNLKETIPLDEKELHDLVELPSESDLDFFTAEFLKAVGKSSEDYQKDFEKLEDSSKLQLKGLIKESAEVVRKNVAGCCEQCPFCKEQCERTDSKHDGSDHFCTLHRPQCLGGYSQDSNDEMELRICTDLVGSTWRFKCTDTSDKWINYKEYRKIYPTWKIPDEGHQSAPYWKWFTAQYTHDIAHMFDFKAASLGSDWTCLGVDDAEMDVKKRYDI